MKIALEQAKKAQAIDEVPVGAVLVSEDGQVLSTAHNLKECTSDPTGHAEILALKKASKELNSWRLEGATLYVTLEPCMMCTGALIHSRIKRVVYGALDPKGGMIESLTKGLEIKELNHRVEAQGGVLKDECSKILSDFFKFKRLKNK